MDQGYHDISQEIGDVPAMVCLEHGSFIPCRKNGEHRDSSDPVDVEKVRYHQQVSVRLQNAPQPEPPAPPVFRKVEAPARDWPFYLDDNYGIHSILCDKMILFVSKASGIRYLKTCAYSLSASTPGQLLREARQHALSTEHYEIAPED
jgi:hypothetical protein